MNNKPKHSASDLIDKMLEKGITFKYDKRSNVENYLDNVNNYLRTASYRKNYIKHVEGCNQGRYINLDFAYLKELSTIDMHLRTILLQMCQDIEHALKVKLVKLIQDNPYSDGYDFVTYFLNNNPHVISSLEQTCGSPYTKQLVLKYFETEKKNNRYKIIDYNNCPIWVMVELLSFGNFISCYNVYFENYIPGCCPTYQYEYKPVERGLLNLTRSLRNCCAHNNCLINNLSTNDAHAPHTISQYLSKVPTITSTQANKKLKCRPILEFCALIYVYKHTVSPKVSYHHLSNIKSLFATRMIEKKNYFKGNDLLISHYSFLQNFLNFYIND